MKIFATLCLAASFSVYAAHPMVSDDTGTQGSGKWQFEANTDQAQSSRDGVRNRLGAYNSAMTYGLAESIDVSLSVPYWRIRQDGSPSQSGVGDVGLAAKWRFYEQDGLSFALKPSLSLPTGNKDKNLGAGRAGVGLAGVTTYTSGKLTWLGNVGLTYADNSTGARKSLWAVSTGVQYALNERLKLALDTGVYRNSDRSDSTNPSFALVGLIYSPSEQLDLDIGYKRGLNHAEYDRSFGIGLTTRW
ncbi:transporter [Chitinimonas sp.]|uniref:transporter n=1 Tax=Chitinimonas sp. TaxID=1934313 RepID=UPI0035AF8073